MERTKDLLEYLRIYHTGRANAVHSEELERLFSIGGRSLRRRVSILRQAGVPICSDENGYYYADSPKEINATVSRLNELVLKISNARTGLMYSSVTPLANGEIEITVRINPAKTI